MERKKLQIARGVLIHSVDAGYDPCTDMVTGQVVIVRDDEIEKISFEAEPEEDYAYETERIKIIWPDYKKKPRRI